MGWQKDITNKIGIMNINEFEIGAEIVRVEPSERIGDRSYIGSKLTLKAIANGCVYLDRCEDDAMTKLLGKKGMELPLDIFSNGWEYYQEVDASEESDKSKLKYNFKKEV
jgi:hypothetical protein